MEYMAGLDDNTFDLAIVDPPYGINIVQEFKKQIKRPSSMLSGMSGIYGNNWDEAVPPKEYFTELNRISINQIIWGGNYFLDYLKSTRCFCIWDKMNGTNNMADAEIAWTSFGSSVRIFRMHHFSSGYDKKIHPTQKPISLYNWLLQNYAKPEMRILDTHLGSGSSAIASHYFGCDFVGCEIDKEYFELAQNRFDRETRQIAFKFE